MLGHLFSERAVRDPVWDAWGRGDDVNQSGNTASGVTVSVPVADQMHAVDTCVSFIADAWAAMSVDVYRLEGGLKVEQPRPRWLLRPNPDRWWSEFVAEWVDSYLKDGNAYVQPIYNGAGQVVELYLLDPSKIEIERPSPNARTVYRFDGRVVTNVIHSRWRPRAGELRGKCPVLAHKETIGTGVALEQFAGRFFGASATPSGIIQAPGNLSAEDAERIKSRWNSFHRGVSRANGIAVLSGGATYQQVTIAPEAAQFLQSRNYNAAQIAAIYKLWPDVVGATLMGNSSITYANITERWNDLLKRWARLTTDLRNLVTFLLPGYGETGWVAELDTDVFAKADMATRFGAWATGISAGFIMEDEARKEEDLPPLPAGADTEVSS